MQPGSVDCRGDVLPQTRPSPTLERIFDALEKNRGDVHGHQDSDESVRVLVYGWYILTAYIVLGLEMDGHL